MQSIVEGLPASAMASTLISSIGAQVEATTASASENASADSVRMPAARRTGRTIMAPKVAKGYAGFNGQGRAPKLPPQQRRTTPFGTRIPPPRLRPAPRPDSFDAT